MGLEPEKSYSLKRGLELVGGKNKHKSLVGRVEAPNLSNLQQCLGGKLFNAFEALLCDALGQLFVP